MATPLTADQLRGSNKSLVLKGKTFPIGPQNVTTFKRPTVSGSIECAAGTVLDGYDLRGRDVVVRGPNVTVRNCLVFPIGYHALNNQYGHPGFVVEFCLLDGEMQNIANHSDLIYSEGSDTIVRNTIILNTPADAVNLAGGQMIQNALSGACFQTGAHSDAISVHKTLGPVKILDNYMDFRMGPQSVQGPNSCVKLVAHFGNIDDVLVQGNVLIGGGYNAYCGPDKGTVNNVRFLDNLMGLTEYGDTPEQFVMPGNHGSNFVMTGNTLFSAAPNDVVSVVGSGSQPPVQPGSTKPINTVPPTIVPGPDAGTYTTASGTWSNVQPDWQWAWEWTIDGAPAGSEVVCTPTMDGQLVVAVSATASDGQKTTVPSLPVAIIDTGGEPPVDPGTEPEPGGKLLTADEVLTIKKSLVTIAKIIE